VLETTRHVWHAAPQIRADYGKIGADRPYYVAPTVS
jgi:hypothetical protein